MILEVVGFTHIVGLVLILFCGTYIGYNCNIDLNIATFSPAFGPSASTIYKAFITNNSRFHPVHKQIHTNWYHSTILHHLTLFLLEKKS